MGHVLEIEGPGGELGLEVDFGPEAISHNFKSADDFLRFADFELTEWHWLEECSHGGVALFFKRQQSAVEALRDAAYRWAKQPHQPERRSGVVRVLDDFLSHRALIMASVPGSYLSQLRHDDGRAGDVECWAAVLAGAQGTRLPDLIARLDVLSKDDRQLNEAYAVGERYRKLVRRERRERASEQAALNKVAVGIDRLKEFEAELTAQQNRLATAIRNTNDIIAASMEQRDRSVKDFEDQGAHLRKSAEELRTEATELRKRFDAMAEDGYAQYAKLAKEMEEAQSGLRALSEAQRQRAAEMEAAAANMAAAIEAAQAQAETSIKERLDAIEKTYTADIELKAAETYWLDKLNDHKDRTEAAERTFYKIGVVSMLTLAVMAWGLTVLFPAEKMSSMILLAVPAGILAWVMRLSHREINSNRSLQDDAAERVAMLKTYVAMGLNTQVDEATRKKAMDSIFRAAAAPPDDGSPVTLIEALGKIAEKAAAKIK